jgi:hypothetical protein
VENNSIQVYFTSGTEYAATDLMEALREFDMPTSGHAVPTQRSGLIWSLLVVLPLHGAIAAAGGEAFKFLLRKVRAAISREKDSPPAHIQDQQQLVVIIVNTTTPDDAIDSLGALIESGQFDAGTTYGFDEGEGAWTAVNRPVGRDRPSLPIADH